MEDRIKSIIIDRVIRGIDKALGPKPDKPKPSYYDQQIERINKRLAELEELERQAQTIPEQTQPENPSVLTVAHRETIETQPSPSLPPAEEVSQGEVGTACIPCINNHFSTCAGLVSDEGMRMALREGRSDEVIRRLNRCLDQLNAMEREDLAPAKIAKLSPKEKELAVYAQKESAEIRHQLENITSLDELEAIAVRIVTARDKIGKEYFEERLKPKPELTLEEAKKLAAEEAAKRVEETWGEKK